MRSDEEENPAVSFRIEGFENEESTASGVFGARGLSGAALSRRNVRGRWQTTLAIGPARHLRAGCGTHQLFWDE